ncbi:MAG: hypothetical protein OEQ13_00090 [Acidobacteriota bacterium]|nr:hypothetical protein [Acidobacteriota bacterium]
MRSRRRHDATSLSMTLSIVTLIVGCATPPPSNVERATRAYASTHPLDQPGSWFMRQRVGERGVYPLAARGRALDAYRALDSAVDTPGAWTAAGPQNIGGRISSLARDPNDVNRIWLGAAQGGVFLSSDGGDTWSPVFDGETALSIGSIAAHPTDSNVVYVGTGEEAGGGYSYDGEGVFKTTDGGTTWTNVGLDAVRRIGRVAIDPVNPQRVFVAASGGLYGRDTNRGLYRSTDGGQTWSQVLYVADDAGVVDVAIDPSDPTRIYAASWQRFRGDNQSYFGGAASGIYRSTDGGDSWSLLTNGLPSGPDVGRIGLAIAPSNTSRVYAIVGRTGGWLDGVYRTDNGGGSWQRVSALTLPFLFSSFTHYFGQIRVDPADDNVVYALDVKLWQSTNGGTSFSAIGAALHADQHAMLVESGGLIYAGNDGGFFKSTDGGGSFVHNPTLPITQFYDLCVSRQRPERRLGGTQDNGTLRTTTGGMSDWTEVLGGDGMQCEIDPTDDLKVYGESQSGNISRSTDGGDSFVPATSGIAGTDRNNWVTPITLDPSLPTTLYTGTQRIYRSTDAAVSWTAISGDLSNGPGDGLDVAGDPHWQENQDHGQTPIQGTVTAIAVSPQDRDVIWAGTDDGNVWVSDDFGFAWTNVTPAGPAYWVTELHPDADDALTAYLTVTGYRLDDKLPYLRVTRDLGGTWEDLSAGLPQVPLNSVVRDPSWRGRLFVASDLGVHVSDDDGLTFSFLGSGMPFVVVQDLVLDGPSRTLFAGTHARSMYSYDLTQLPPADGDGDGVDNNADCALRDPGAFSSPGAAGPLVASEGAGGTADLSWPSLAGTAGPGTVFHVARGTLADLAAKGDTTGSNDLACGLLATTVSDPGLPAAGAGFYYIVRPENACGAGSWGTSSGGLDRSSPACP